MTSVTIPTPRTQMTTMQKLYDKFPNRNWGELWRRYQDGKYVPSTIVDVFKREGFIGDTCTD
jgi:hypothetical protein